MTRTCAVESIRHNIKANLIGIGRNSAKDIKENVILLPVGGLDGNNKSLGNKEATHKWAKDIQTKINKLYRSELYGNLIEIDNVSNPKGTLINITIPKLLIDAYEKLEEGKHPSVLKNIVYNGINLLGKRTVSSKVIPEKKHEVFFKRMIKDLNKEIRILNEKIALEPYNENLQEELNTKASKLIRINSALLEYLETNNKQLLINAANEVLDDIEKDIEYWEEQLNKNNKSINVDRLEKDIHIIQMFMELTGTRDRAGKLYERMRPKDSKSILTKYVLNLVRNATGKDLDESDIDYNSKDIFVGEKNFGTLSDVTNYLGKTVGHEIKEAQNKILESNRESYNELKKHIDILESYNKRNNILSNKAFDIFIQESNVTTILTKEFTTAFYDELRKANKMEREEGLAYKRSIAIFSQDKKVWEPRNRDKYINRNYIKIMSTPELKQFYEFYQKSIKEIFEKLPINRSTNFIPNIAEQTLLDIIKSDRSVQDKFKESIENITGVYDLNKQEDGFVNEENLLSDEIPLKYIGNLGTELKSRNLDKSLLTFMQFANNYTHMSEILPKTRLLQEEIKSRKFLSNTNNDLMIEGKDSNIYKMTKDFIEMQVKGKTKKEEILGKFDYGKYIDFGLKYTSLLRIGLNPFNAITNIFVGSIGNIIEAVGGRYFTLSEFSKASKIFFSEVGNKDSKVNKLIDLYNPLMELEDYENMQNIQIGSKEYKEKIKSIMYAPQRLGEKMMQTSTMIASMLHDKITTKEGKSISLWEAFDEKGVWNEELMGRPLSKDEIFKSTNKIQRINQMIHGRYSAKDAATLTQYSLFRAAFQFKKWIPAAFESRFQSRRTDDRLGYDIEGRYITLWNLVGKKIFSNPFEAIQNLVGPLLSQKKMLEKGNLTELDIYNMRKNMMELTIILASVLMFIGLGPDEDEKKTSGWYKFSMNQLDRISGDLLFFYQPGQLNKGLIGVPMSKTIADLIKVVKSVPYAFGIDNSEYQSGPRKGENKFIASGLDILPVIKPITDVVRLHKDDVPFQELK